VKEARLPKSQKKREKPWGGVFRTGRQSWLSWGKGGGYRRRRRTITGIGQRGEKRENVNVDLLKK